jgi:hypothetical protein
LPSAQVSFGPKRGSHDFGAATTDRVVYEPVSCNNTNSPDPNASNPLFLALRIYIPRSLSISISRPDA